MPCVIRKAFQKPRLWREPHLHLEDGKLHALSEVKAGLGDATQAPGAAGASQGHVVGDEHEHAADLFPEPRWIGVQVAAHVARQHLRLKVWREAEGRFLVEKGMLTL